VTRRRTAPVPDMEAAEAAQVALLIDRTRALQDRGRYQQVLDGAAELQARYPGSHVEPWGLRGGTTGLSASWQGSTVAGTGAEVREWLAGQAERLAS
jgi:hypothetical protein